MWGPLMGPPECSPCLPVSFLPVRWACPWKLIYLNHFGFRNLEPLSGTHSILPNTVRKYWLGLERTKNLFAWLPKPMMQHQPSSTLSCSASGTDPLIQPGWLAALLPAPPPAASALPSIEVTSSSQFHLLIFPCGDPHTSAHLGPYMLPRSVHCYCKLLFRNYMCFPINFKLLRVKLVRESIHQSLSTMHGT